jgi:hypothetical protein
MVIRGVVARVWNPTERLRFIPLEKDGTALTEGHRRLRLTRYKRGEPKPGRGEWEMLPYAGRTIAVQGADYDDEWVYGCVDAAMNQP